VVGLERAFESRTHFRLASPSFGLIHDRQRPGAGKIVGTRRRSSRQRGSSWRRHPHGTGMVP
jgi:hypothetical protein